MNNLYEHKSGVWWNIDFFSRYLNEQIYPRGLQIQIFPLICEITNDFSKKLEDNVQQCTRNMIVLLMNFYEEQLKNIDKELSYIVT